MTRWLWLLILVAACQSTPSTDAPPVVAKVSEPPTKEERSENARMLLAEAGQAENDCAKGDIYQRVLDDYGDLPEAKFAKKSIGGMRNHVASLYKKMRVLMKKAEKLDDYESQLTNRINSAEEMASTCQAFKDLDEKEAEYYRNLRLKKYGY